jgi:hypothetical protein
MTSHCLHRQHTHFCEHKRKTKKYNKLEKLQEHDFFLKAKKCKCCKTKIKYLGIIIEEGKIAMDSVKLGGIRDWPVPTMVKQVWSFGNFYQKFVFHYLDLSWPLNNLTKKDKKFE